MKEEEEEKLLLLHEVFKMVLMCQGQLYGLTIFNESSE
jgi:hypothetical protein